MHSLQTDHTPKAVPRNRMRDRTVPEAPTSHLPVAALPPDPAPRKETFQSKLKQDVVSSMYRDIKKTCPSISYLGRRHICLYVLAQANSV